MATAGTNSDNITKSLKEVREKVKKLKAKLAKPLSKKEHTKLQSELRILQNRESRISGKTVKTKLTTANTDVQQIKNNNNNLTSQIQTPGPPPKKRQKISDNNNNNNNANIEENRDDELGSQSITPAMSLSDGSNDEEWKGMFAKFMSWYQNNNNKGQPKNDENNENIVANPAPQDTGMTKAMKNKIITSSRTEELKEVQVYKGVKFSGVGTDKYIKAAEFMTSVRNFERQGKLIFGFREDRAIRSIRTNGFSGNAELMVAQAVPQAIETFDDFYNWFENTWDMSTARQELFNHFMHFKMPSSITPDELSQHIKHYKQIFDSVGDKCTKLVQIQTTLKEIDVINVVYNSMCKEWQEVYDKICEIYMRPLNLELFMDKLSKMTTYIIEYNVTHTQQPIPLKSPTKSTVNRLYQQPNYSPNPRYNPTYTGKGRTRDTRTSETPRKQYKQSQNQQQTKPVKGNQKQYKDPYYLDAWCPICGMGGHTKRFHWIMIKKYPNKLLEFATLYQQKRDKQQVNKIQQGEPKIDNTNESNQESVKTESTTKVKKEPNFIMTDTEGMMD